MKSDVKWPELKKNSNLWLFFSVQVQRETPCGLITGGPLAQKTETMTLWLTIIVPLAGGAPGGTGNAAPLTSTASTANLHSQLVAQLKVWFGSTGNARGPTPWDALWWVSDLSTSEWTAALAVFEPVTFRPLARVVRVAKAPFQCSRESLILVMTAEDVDKKDFMRRRTSKWVSLAITLAPLQALAPGGGGGTHNIFGWGCTPDPENPYPISDQKLQFSIPYFRPDSQNVHPISDPVMCDNLGNSQ